MPIEAHEMVILRLHTKLPILVRGEGALINCWFYLVPGDELHWRELPFWSAELDSQSDALDFVSLWHIVFLVEIPGTCLWRNVLNHSICKEELYWVDVSLSPHQHFENPHPNFYTSIECIECILTHAAPMDFLWLLKTDFEGLGCRPIRTNIRTLLSFAIVFQIRIKAGYGLGSIEIGDEVEQHGEGCKFIGNGSQVVFDRPFPVDPTSTSGWLASNHHLLYVFDFGVGHICLILIPFQVLAHVEAEHVGELNPGGSSHIDIHAREIGHRFLRVLMLKHVPPSENHLMGIVGAEVVDELLPVIIAEGIFHSFLEILGEGDIVRIHRHVDRVDLAVGVGLGDSSLLGLSGVRELRKLKRKGKGSR